MTKNSSLWAVLMAASLSLVFTALAITTAVAK